jgi:hypothetical protein
MPRDPNTGKFVSGVPRQGTGTTSHSDVVKADKPRNPGAELGISTKHRLGRNLYDDFLPQLRGQKAARIYREMSDNDATVGGVLFAIENLLRELTWTAVPSDDLNDEAVAQADFVNECLDDMTHAWGDHISAALTMLSFGFAPFEIVYRRRTERDGSKFDDGQWGWRKFAYRPQDTIAEIQTDRAGGYEGIWQYADESQVFIPIEKLVVYRTTMSRGPEGRSLLRNAYVPWFRKKRAEELLLIGIERDLAGLPTAWIPADDILGGGASYDMWKRIVQRTKRDEQDGLVLPLEYDENGNRLYDFTLMSSGSGRDRLGSVLAVTRSWANDIAGSMLADWAGLGRDAVGSRALAAPKIDIFLKALETYADMIADTVSRHAIPRLMALNGVPRQLNPIMTHSPVEDIDLEALGSFIQRTAQAGMAWYGSEGGDVERETMELAGFDAEFDVDDLGFEREPLMPMEADPVEMPDE